MGDYNICYQTDMYCISSPSLHLCYANFFSCFLFVPILWYFLYHLFFDLLPLLSIYFFHFHNDLEFLFYNRFLCLPSTLVPPPLYRLLSPVYSQSPPKASYSEGVLWSCQFHFVCHVTRICCYFTGSRFERLRHYTYTSVNSLHSGSHPHRNRPKLELTYRDSLYRC